MGVCWNWQTGQTQNLLQQCVWVQVPLPPPPGLKKHKFFASWNRTAVESLGLTSFSYLKKSTAEPEKMGAPEINGGAVGWRCCTFSHKTNRGEYNMSYKKPNTGNIMNDYFTALSDFNMLSINLLSAETEQSFTTWLEKLIAIDKRATQLFIKKHEKEINSDYLTIADWRLSKIKR